MIGTPLSEWDAAGNRRAWTIYGAKTNEIVARNDYTYGPLLYKQDNQGSVTFIMNGSNEVVEAYTYDAFGKPTVTNGDGTAARGWSNYGNRFMFTGREYLSQPGIYDYRHRMYDPDTGRFPQTDPTGFDAGDMNLFRYCGDDPVDRSDPTGLEFLSVSEDVDVYARMAALKTQELYRTATVHLGMERNISVFRNNLTRQLSLSKVAIGGKDPSGTLVSRAPDPGPGFSREASAHNHPNGERISWQDRVAGDILGEAVYAQGSHTERWRPDASRARRAHHIGGVRERWDGHGWKREPTPKIPPNADLRAGGSVGDGAAMASPDSQPLRVLDTLQLVLDLTNGNNAGEGVHPRGPR